MHPHIGGDFAIPISDTLEVVEAELKSILVIGAKPQNKWSYIRFTDGLEVTYAS